MDHAAYGPDRVRESRRLAHDSRARARATRARVRDSLRLLGRLLPIVGGSEETPRAQLRARLVRGDLPALTTERAWAGPCTGRETCMVCQRPIRDVEIEYEIESATIRGFAHLPCYVDWAGESRALRSRAADGTAEAAGTH